MTEVNQRSPKVENNPPNKHATVRDGVQRGMLLALLILLSAAQSKHAATVLTPKRSAARFAPEIATTQSTRPARFVLEWSIISFCKCPCGKQGVFVRAQMFLCILLKYFLLLKGTYSGTVNKTD